MVRTDYQHTRTRQLSNDLVSDIIVLQEVEWAEVPFVAEVV